MTPTIYAFYNNKGGVGKTTLCGNAASLYAEKNPRTQVIVIDLCPQANVSQFLLGGGHIGYQKNQAVQTLNSRRNIVGFMDWLLRGNSNFTSIKQSYTVQVTPHNPVISKNLFLIAGDSFLESLSLALNYAVINPANRKAWVEYMTAIKRLCVLEYDSEQFESMTVFIDCNPSFSIYTQMGLLSSDRLIVPMMADFSSLEGIKGILMLLYGHYPTAALKTYADDFITFNGQVKQFELQLPVLYEFVFNNFTSNSGVAHAFDSVRNELINFCYTQYKNHPHLFYPSSIPINSADDLESVYVSNTKDFHTSGKVSASLGIPMHKLTDRTQYTMPDGESIKLPAGNYKDSLQDVNNFVNRIL